jgi:hypothetical protein
MKKNKSSKILNHEQSEEIKKLSRMLEQLTKK